MANIASWLQSCEKAINEEIEAIVIGRHYDDEYLENDELARPPAHLRNKVLDRETGLKILDLGFDDDYGGADCFPCYAWTKSRVLFISEYDGATTLSSIPRNPIDCVPTFS